MSDPGWFSLQRTAIKWGLVVLVFAGVLIAGGCLLGLALAGCVAPGGDAAILKQDVDLLSGEVENLRASVIDLGDRLQVAGRDINEPVTGWILALGYVLLPGGIGLFAVALFFLWRRTLRMKNLRKPFSAS